MNRYLVLFLGLGFFLVAYVAFIDAKPSSKAPIYKEIKKYSPYYLEKRFGGLKIKSKLDNDFEEKPSSMEIFHKLEKLEKEWGKKSLELKDDKLFIKDSNGKIIKTILVKTQQDREFLKNYFGVK